MRRGEGARRQGLPVWGTGRPTREFLYVEDAAEALVLAAEGLETPDPVNVGSGQEIAIARPGQTDRREDRASAGELKFDPNMPDGQPRRCLDVTRAKELLGFTAKTTLAAGLEKTIAWYWPPAGRPLGGVMSTESRTDAAIRVLVSKHGASNCVVRQHRRPAHNLVLRPTAGARSSELRKSTRGAGS